MKTMISRVTLAVFGAVLICILGCSSTRYDSDWSQSDTHKGYVEFSVPGQQDWGFWIRETTCAGEQKSTTINGKFTRRIALTPGIHQFTVMVKSASRPVRVNVEEGMVTPVEILIREMEREVTFQPVIFGPNEYHNTTTKISFALGLLVKPPRPTDGN